MLPIKQPQSGQKAYKNVNGSTHEYNNSDQMGKQMTFQKVDL